MKKSRFLSLATFYVAIAISTISCDKATKEEVATTAAVTNPLFAIAPAEYAEMSEKAITDFANFDYDAWATTLADNVEYSFPDGDQDTRTKLVGKPAVIAWWKNFQKSSGISSMILNEFNNMPIEVTGEAKGGASKGMYVISYFTNKMTFGEKAVSLRMNFSVHFNADKKIDRYATYYDRTPLIKAMGKNLLEKK